MGCTLRANKFPCFGSLTSNFKLSPKTFIKQRSSLIIETYKIGRKLGAGSFGIVRLVQHKTTGQKRAIKSIKKSNISQELHLTDFMNEIKILMETDHPHIIRLYEFFEDQKYWHLVTEYLSGGELFDFFIKNKYLDEKTASSFISQLLSAVAYCHSKDIVHRDLKPENLLLTSDNKSLKVIDFGTSTFMTGKSLNRRYGTSYYLAPEILRSFYNEKCDLWSVGVILYLLLSGKPPFPGKQDKDILMKVERGIYAFRGEQWRKVSNEAQDLVSRLLCYNPKTRISASEALNHPWLVKFADGAESSNCIALKNLSEFCTTQKLQNAVLTFMISQLSQVEELNEISSVFKTIDINSDGKISKDELRSLYNLSGLAFLGKNVEKIIEEVDSNGSGYIDYTEFLVACRKKELLSNIQDLENTFKTFDIDKNGRITAAELKEILGNGAGADRVWASLIQEADMNQDGGLDIEEFKNMMLKMVN